MHYSFHRRSMLALAALPLASAAANATSLNDSKPEQASMPERVAMPERAAPEGDHPAELTGTNMVGKKLRVIKQGDMVTMDYSTDRVNIEVDENSKILRVFIG